MFGGYLDRGFLEAALPLMQHLPEFSLRDLSIVRIGHVRFCSGLLLLPNLLPVRLAFPTLTQGFQCFAIMAYESTHRTFTFPVGSLCATRPHEPVAVGRCRSTLR